MLLGVSAYYAGIPGILFALGGYIAFSNWLNPKPKALITADTNQYRDSGASSPSICTSCAAAFLKAMCDNKPLNAQTIIDSISSGRDAHQSVVKELGRNSNENLAAAEVLAHGGLGLQQSEVKSGRPTSQKTQKENYLKNLVEPLQGSSPRYAILTKAPYSLAIVHKNGKFILFDSHGEAETQNRAFIRTFSDGDALCEYLVKKFGFDADFPDVDFDVGTQQDNPNSYEITFVDQIEIQFPQGGLPERVDQSLLLKQPIDPPRIQWEDNSCFISSAMWSFFLNEPAVLGELPVAIVKRINDEVINEICNLSHEKAEELFKINSSARLTNKDFAYLRKTLQEVKIRVSPKLKELLSLLELHELINYCQTHKVIPGEKINAVREMVGRINRDFTSLNGDYGDAHAVLCSLADLIFTRGPFKQTWTTHRNNCNSADKKDCFSNEVSASSWGHFALDIQPSKSPVKDALTKAFFPDSYSRKQNGQKYEVFESSQLDFPPPLLIINREPSKVVPEERFTLEGQFFRNKETAEYQLCGVSRHLGIERNSNHYDASFRVNGKTFHCDDLHRTREEISSEEFLDSATTGYVLIYRQVK